MQAEEGCGRARRLPARNGVSALRAAGRWFVWVLGAGLFMPGPARAQLGGMNAEFAGGGARAMAMGGAFIALADDATATEFNPAGLWQLRTAEVALQGIYRVDRRRVPLIQRSSIESRPVFDTDTDEYPVPSFASFVFPSTKVVVGLSTFTNVYFDRDYTDAVLDVLTDEVFPVRASEEARNNTFGLTLATALARTLTVGATLRYNRFRYEFGYHYDPEHLSYLSRDTRVFEDDAFSANAGVIWRIRPNLRLGGVYKSPQALKGSYDNLDVDTELPDTWGLGLAYLPLPRWCLLADIDRIRWSRFDPNPDDGFTKEDVLRYHVGTEWYAGKWRRTGVLLRGGYCYEESDAFRYRGRDPVLRALASERDAVEHYTAGLGLVTRRCQLDLGVDLTDSNGAEWIVSSVWYF